MARLLGSDTLASAVVLGVFLGGLSLGYWLCGRLTLRLRNPGAAYGAIEAAIGLWGLAFPVLFAAVTWATRGWSFTYPLALLIQGTIVAALMIAPPTLLMGGTVPLLTRALTNDLAGATQVHARIYALNTAGAAAGTLAAGFALLPVLGLPGTVRAAAATNAVAGLFFWWRFRLVRSVPTAAPTARPPVRDPETQISVASAAPRQVARGSLLAVAALSGVAVMTLEPLLIRLTTLSLGSSSYSFTLIVAAFILCIAAGAHRAGRRSPYAPWVLMAAQAGIALSLFGLLATLDTWPYGAHLIRIAFQNNVLGFTLFHATAFAAIVLLLLIPVGLIGATLPLIFDRLKRPVETVGVTAGRLFALSAAGNLAGALAGGYLAYRWLDLRGVFLCAMLTVAIATVLAGAGLGRARRLAGVSVALGAMLIALMVPFESQRFARGPFRLRAAQPYSFDGPAAFHAGLRGDDRLIAYRDAPEGSFAVLERPASRGEELPGFLRDLLADAPPPNGPVEADAAPSRTLMVNGKPDSNTFSDRETLKLLSHLPALLAPRHRRIFMVGLGTGLTAGELTRYPDVETIRVAEISPTVAGFFPLFGDQTDRAHVDPRIDIEVGDAFRLLARSLDRWDVIICEPSNPWVTGVGQLYSREFYRLVKERLAEDGLFVQWLQRYETSPQVRAIALNTLRLQFDHLSLFEGAAGDEIYIASPHPLTAVDLARAGAELIDRAGVRSSLQGIGVRGAGDLLARRLNLDAVLAGLPPTAEIETLDHPRIHYLSGYAFFTGENSSAERLMFEF